MSKRHDSKGRSTTPQRYVRLMHWFMNTPAWNSLDGNQRAIYVAMAKHYNGSNNGRIHYSVREAVKSLPIGKTTAARALLVLQERGFIVPVTKGAFSVKIKLATEWRLTEFDCNVFGEDASKDFVRWLPNIQNTVPLQPTTVPLQTSSVPVAGPRVPKCH